jgi:uncharacterized protein (UPF0248 family)
MKTAMLLVLAGVALVGALLAFITQLRYSITDRHLRVTLFGLCLRRVQLSDITSVSKRLVHWAERWQNTLQPAHRVLVIHRRRGLFKDFVITPANRYVFKSELEKAMAKARSDSKSRSA